MKTAVITDGKYRAAIPAARALGRAGYQVVVLQTRGDCPLEPPVFSSRFVREGRWLEGAVEDAAYPEALLEVLSAHERPLLLCVGAGSLRAVSRQRERFARVCDFLIAPPEVLEALNDKAVVHRRCLDLGIPVPRQYQGPPEAYPVVIKPHCGETLGLKAAQRYALAGDPAEYAARLAAMQRYDPAPLVQEKITGAGAGACLLLDRDSRLVSALCHRRVREYPLTGGPSTCCESFYDETMIDRAYRLLASFGFVGMAMVEFKGDRVLEVNPRVWGSFPLTNCARSPFTLRYGRAAAGEVLDYTPGDYQTGVRMRFLLNDTVATLACLGHGDLGAFARGVADAFTAREALWSREDPAPMVRTLGQQLLRR